MRKHSNLIIQWAKDADCAVYCRCVGVNNWKLIEGDISWLEYAVYAVVPKGYQFAWDAFVEGNLQIKSGSDWNDWDLNSPPVFDSPASEYRRVPEPTGGDFVRGLQQQVNNFEVKTFGLSHMCKVKVQNKLVELAQNGYQSCMLKDIVPAEYSDVNYDLAILNYVISLGLRDFKPHPLSMFCDSIISWATEEDIDGLLEVV